MMKEIRIGVIGTGNMGRNHVRNLAEEKRFQLVGVYDIDKNQAYETAEKYGVKMYEDMEQLLKDIDAVVIAVPSYLHKEIGLKAAEYNVHALIEKPLATTAKDANEIVKAFKERELKLAVGHIERFNPVFMELHKLVKTENIIYIEAHRYSPFSGSGRITDTSVVEDLMIHDIDLVCSLMEESKIKTIKGYGEVVRSKGQADFSTCVLEFETNAHAIINASRISQNKDRTIEIHTTDSYIFADLVAKTLCVSKNTDLTIDLTRDDSYKQDGIVQKIYVPIQEPLRAELIAFYEAIINNSVILVDGRVGVRAIEICEEVVKQITLS